MITDILDWRSKLSGRGGLAKSARFRVSIMSNTGFLAGQQNFLREFPFYCADAEIAGISLNTVDARIYGPLFKTPSQVAFNDITLHILTGEDMLERSFFGEWIDYISGDGTFDFRFRNEYATTIILEKLSEKASGTSTPNPGTSDGVDVNFTLEFRNAYPVQVLTIPVSWGDEGFLRTQVQFSYTHHIQK